MPKYILRFFLDMKLREEKRVNNVNSKLFRDTYCTHTKHIKHVKHTKYNKYTHTHLTSILTQSN
jgi:hypothetical protein